jgi:putative flippase GtrA
MKKLIIKYREILTYLVTGVLATLISWGSYPPLLKLFVYLFGENNSIHIIKDFDINILTASFFSWLFAFSFAFITNKIWVFESKSWERKLVTKEFFGFLASRAFTGVLEVVCVPLFVTIGLDGLFTTILQKLHINIAVLYSDGMCSKIAVSVIVVILNYVFSKLFVFKNKKESNESEKD